MLTMFSPDAKIYASVALPGTVDQAVQYVLDTLQTPMPLSMLLLTTLPQEMEHHVTTIAAVAEEVLDGQTATHLAARSADVDFEVWVATGDQPVPLRVVFNYKTAKSEPQFRATLRKWNFSPATDTTAFTFVPPADARGVAFMVPVPGKRSPSGARR
jgi:hypothetical protein